MDFMIKWMRHKAQRPTTYTHKNLYSQSHMYASCSVKCAFNERQTMRWPDSIVNDSVLLLFLCAKPMRILIVRLSVVAAQTIDNWTWLRFLAILATSFFVFQEVNKLIATHNQLPLDTRKICWSNGWNCDLFGLTWTGWNQGSISTSRRFEKKYLYKTTHLLSRAVHICRNKLGDQFTSIVRYWLCT